MYSDEKIETICIAEEPQLHRLNTRPHGMSETQWNALFRPLADVDWPKIEDGPMMNFMIAHPDLALMRILERTGESGARQILRDCLKAVLAAKYHLTTGANDGTDKSHPHANTR